MRHSELCAEVLLVHTLRWWLYANDDNADSKNSHDIINAFDSVPTMQGASSVSSQYMSAAMIAPWQQADAPPGLDEHP